eukprot:3308629-Rhodomonas_salina.2
MRMRMRKRKRKREQQEDEEVRRGGARGPGAEPAQSAESASKLTPGGGGGGAEGSQRVPCQSAVEMSMGSGAWRKQTHKLNIGTEIKQRVSKVRGDSELEKQRGCV